MYAFATFSIYLIHRIRIRGIYSYQFAELGKGKKNQPLKKEGKKISQGNDDKKGITGKRGANQGKEGSSGKKREAVGK